VLRSAANDCGCRSPKRIWPNEARSTAPYVTGVERGERSLGLVNVYRLADALDIPAAEPFAMAEATRRTAQHAGRGRRR
jgi:hypothetical protein